MAGVGTSLMMAWQACGRDEGGGRRRGAAGGGLGGQLGGGAWGEGHGGRCCCVLCSPVRELELLDVRSLLRAVRAG
jgi:hypothetical protein